MGSKEELEQIQKENRELSLKLIGYFQMISLSLTCLIDTLAKYDSSFLQTYREKFQAQAGQLSDPARQVALEVLMDSLSKKGKPN